jgi:hypothetical protein
VATLEITNNWSVALDGTTHTGKQGDTDGTFAEPFEFTVSGYVHRVRRLIATATVYTVYDDDDDLPADFVYAWYVCTVDSYIQIIGSGSNVVFKCEAYLPFVLPGFDTMLGAANTTAITGGTEPTLTDIDSIVVGNYSGGSGTFEFVAIE